MAAIKIEAIPLFKADQDHFTSFQILTKKANDGKPVDVPFEALGSPELELPNNVTGRVLEFNTLHGSAVVRVRPSSTDVHKAEVAFRLRDNPSEQTPTFVIETWRSQQAEATDKRSRRWGDFLVYAASMLAALVTLLVVCYFGVPNSVIYGDGSKIPLTIIGIVATVAILSQTFLIGAIRYGVMTSAWAVVAILLVLKFGWRAPEKAGVDMVRQELGNIVVEHSEQVRNQTFKKPERYRDNDGNIDLRNLKVVSSDAAGQIAEANEILKEGVAEAKGQMLEHPARFLAGRQASWLPTGIPITSCVEVWMKGKIERDPYTKAGPEGLDFSKMTRQDVQMYLQAHSDKRTLMPKVAWGVPLGKSCQDKQGEQCGPEFPIYDIRFISKSWAGSGELWVIPNGFVTGESGANILSGKSDLVMSDYNVYKGGFEFDQKKVADEMCSQPATMVAAQ